MNEKNIKLDLSRELGVILNYTSQTAMLIRLHSAYTRGDDQPEDPNAKYDLLWLSDSLHNFDLLGHSLIKNNPEGIISGCDTLLELYRDYITNDSGYNSKAAFERAAEHGLEPDKMISVLEDIKDKAQSVCSRNLADPVKFFV